MVRNIVSMGSWDKARKFEEGYCDSPLCDRCGLRPDNLYHRCLECNDPQLVNLRDNLDPIVRAFMQAFSPTHPVWKTLLVGCYGHRVPSPSLLQKEEVEGSSLYPFELFLFLDGSAYEGKHPLLARVGYSVVCTARD